MAEGDKLVVIRRENREFNLAWYLEEDCEIGADVGNSYNNIQFDRDNCRDDNEVAISEEICERLVRESLATEAGDCYFNGGRYWFLTKEKAKAALVLINSEIESRLGSKEARNGQG